MFCPNAVDCGDVAMWAGAVGTGGAAITAASYYVVDLRRKTRAQAELVKADVPAGREFGIRVHNGSERPSLSL
jgi:hypothetical protein